MKNNEHVFKYLPGESGDTLWPSMLSSTLAINNAIWMLSVIIMVICIHVHW